MTDTVSRHGAQLPSTLEDASWYAVLTRSRQEKIAATMLDYYAVVNFLPLIQQERTWSDRKQTVTLPLFPSYLFVRTPRSSEVLLRVLMVPGIVDFVRNRNGPLPIPDTEIEAVRAVLSRTVGCSPHAFFNAGDRVRVMRGPLAGIEGLLLRSGGQSKLILSVEMIQRSVAVNVEASDVEPIARIPARDQSIVLHRATA